MSLSLADKISKVVIVSDIVIYYLTQNLVNIKLLTSGINHRFKNILWDINICLSLIKHNKNTEDISGNCKGKDSNKEALGVY